MKTNVMEIRGQWDLGYALDWHVEDSSLLSGHNSGGKPEFDTIRTEIGEAIFQLKYRQDQTKIEALSEAMVANLSSAFQTVSFVVPMPPSKYRSVQPAVELARQVSEKMSLPFFDNILLKQGTTLQMKDIASRKKKAAALMECFYINDEITDSDAYDVLVIDDLCASGASLSAATRVLRSYSKVRKVFVAVFSRTR